MLSSEVLFIRRLYIIHARIRTTSTVKPWEVVGCVSRESAADSRENKTD